MLKTVNIKSCNMDLFLVRPFTIYNHPIKNLDECYRIQYLEGLQEFLAYLEFHHLNYNTSKLKVLYELWANSITKGNIPQWTMNESLELSKIEAALSIKRKGLSFFTMRKPLFFDIFYLLAKIDASLLEEAYKILCNQVCGPITQIWALDPVYEYFIKGVDDTSSIIDNLKKHKDRDKHLCMRPFKRILVVSTINAGKSTLINAIVGTALNKARNSACTSSIRYIYGNSNIKGMITKDIRGIYSYSDKRHVLNEDIDSVSLSFNANLNSRSNVCLIDTPGVNSKNNAEHATKTYDYIKSNNYDVVLFVSNCQYFGTDDDEKLLSFIAKYSKRPLVCVLNQLDRFQPTDDSITSMLSEFQKVLLEKRLKSKVVPVSAYAALLMKSRMETLSKYDLLQLSILDKKFQNDYYDLPSYTSEGLNLYRNLPKTNFDKTGIRVLEYLLNNI